MTWLIQDSWQPYMRPTESKAHRRQVIQHSIGSYHPGDGTIQRWQPSNSVLVRTSWGLFGLPHGTWGGYAGLLAAAVTTRSTSNGPTYRDASFQDSVWRGMSLEDSQTLWPAWEGGTHLPPYAFTAAQMGLHGWKSSPLLLVVEEQWLVAQWCLERQHPGWRWRLGVVCALHPE